MQRKRRSVGDGARPWLGLGLALAVAVAVAAWLLCGREAAARPRLFRASELARYRGGAAEPGLYLALLGRVFDVAAGRAHYTRGGAYEGLAGRDASRAFVTGDFSDEGLSDDVSDFSPAQMLVLRDWLQFYEKNYACVGKLIGRFYEENGDPTSALLLAEATMAQGDASRETENQQRQHFPACNSEWRSGSLGRFWCSKQSGGVNRDWTGVPRKLYRPGGKKPRCVCVRTTGPPTGQKSSASHGDRGDLDNPSLQEYSGCPPLASSCILQD
ncbi:neuferricin isoform X1 [Trichosurus vulpecula]|uniref:neuferricin isoform X1 n=1 Tax=Trichosurus vulpecula TaxID=9337 RepID=UPI00186B1344|nr:neuferricin isoform X1 [Trichosurus vulpecula]